MKKHNKGFTLAELLIVVAVIAVLVAVAIPTFSSQLEKSRQQIDIANLRSAYSAAVYAAMSGKSDSGVDVAGKKFWYDPDEGTLIAQVAASEAAVSADVFNNNARKLGRAKSTVLKADDSGLAELVNVTYNVTSGGANGVGLTQHGILITFGTGATPVPITSVTFADSAGPLSGGGGGSDISVTNLNLTLYKKAGTAATFDVATLAGVSGGTGALTYTPSITGTGVTATSNTITLDTTTTVGNISGTVTVEDTASHTKTINVTLTITDAVAFPNTTEALTTVTATATEAVFTAATGGSGSYTYTIVSATAGGTDIASELTVDDANHKITTSAVGGFASGTAVSIELSVKDANDNDNVAASNVTITFTPT